MRQRLFMIILILLVFPLVAAESMVEFDFLIDKDDNVELYNVRTFVGSAERMPLDSEYQLEIRGMQFQKLNQAAVPVFFALLDPFVEVEQVPVSVKLPYKASYKTVEVTKSGKAIYQQDISSLCRQDGICQETENYASCPEDCSSGSADGLCVRIEDGICDADCIAGDVDCEAAEIVSAERKFTPDTTVILLIVVFVVIMLSVLLWLRFRGKLKQ